MVLNTTEHPQTRAIIQAVIVDVEKGEVTAVHDFSEPDVTANLDNYRKLTREHAEIAPVVQRYGDAAARAAAFSKSLPMAASSGSTPWKKSRSMP